MAQSNKSLAFRARLRKKGYTDIKIKRCRNLDGKFVYNEAGNQLYNVYCIEPLLGFDVTFTVSEQQMSSWPGIPFYGCGYFTRQLELDLDTNGDGIFV